MPMMRRDDPPAQDSLAGARVKISDSYFLVGLNRADADAARNLDLIASRGWFDFPLLLNDDRIAKLTFEKGPDGDRILTAALAAWTAQPQVPEPQPTPAAQAAPPSPTAPSPKQVPSVTPTTVTSSGGEDCSTVTDPTQRLACYDRVSASPAAPSIALPTPARSNVPATPTDAETRDDEPVQNLADYLGVWVEFQEDRGWNITLVPKQESLTVNKISVNRGNCHSQYDDKINFPLRIKLGTKVSYHVLDFCNILEIEVVTDHGPGIFYYKTDDLIRSGVSLEKTYSRTGVRDTTTNFYAIDVTFYTIAVTSRVDNIIIRSITANDGTCIPLQKRQSLPVSLKFGEKYLVSFADCDPIQINVATDIGSTVFTWNQR
jgi:hypothetical protein